MKLIRVHIISAATCGGLLDGLDVWLRSPSCDSSKFDPLCLVGPNGSGKSQFLQVIAEIFQSALNACAIDEERIAGNLDMQFELEYLIVPEDEEASVHVRLERIQEGKRKPTIVIQCKDKNLDQWQDCSLSSEETRRLLPRKIIGYTSGDNETLSLPFLVSRSGYADEVGRTALNKETRNQFVTDTRLMQIDYSTHLEVLVANLLLGDGPQRESLLKDAGLHELHSFRCIVQLAHSAAPKIPGKKFKNARKGIQLTAELESNLDNLKRCATCYSYDEKTESYTFDYWLNDQTRVGFLHFWQNTLNLYTSFHKLAMLNDLAIPRKTRDRFKRDSQTRRFASRLPEPQDEDKVFRFERVSFLAKSQGNIVDYVSLSDGEHQLTQLLGTFCMLSFPNLLFLLDEPESHFNPLWRTKVISRIRALPTDGGERKAGSKAAKQDCLITTHSPFVPSDMQRTKVFIFGKNEDGKIEVKNPDFETFGTTFDTILEGCFDIRPPISEVPLEEIEWLMKSENPKEIKNGMAILGDSVQKVFLADRLRQLEKKGGK